MISKIDNILIGALKHRYNRRLPQVAFGENGWTNLIASRLKDIRIFPFPKERRFLRWRLPQTRIWYTEFELKNGTCRMVEYFGSCILIFTGETQEKSDLKIEMPLGITVLASVPFERSAENRITFNLKRNALFWFNPPPPKNTIEDLPAWLGGICKHEYALHPLKQVFALDVNLLKKIDERWAMLEGVDEKGMPALSKIVSQRAEDFLWLHEIFLFLDRQQAFSRVYDSLETTSAAIRPILLKCKRRWKGAASLANAKTPASFLELFLNGAFDSDETKKRLQQFWDRISRPYLNVFFAEQVHQNPDEFVAFALLALYNRFWWFDRLYRQLIPLLPPTTRLLFELLVYLNKIALQYINYNMRFYAPFNEESAFNRITSAGCAYFSYGKQRFSALTFKDGLQFKINRFVQLRYQFQQKTLWALPLLSPPPLDRPSVRFIKLQIEEHTLRLPLVWEQFEIHFKGVRIRFLKKKKNFQLTFRQRKDFPQVFLEDREVTFSADLKRKILIDLKRKESRMNIRLYQESGTEIHALSASLSRAVFAGVAVDGFGILRSAVNLHFNRSVSSNTIAIGSAKKTILPLPHPVETITIRARKCNMRVYRLLYEDGLITSFKQTEGVILKNNLIIYIAEELWPRLSEIAQLIRVRLGFRPPMEKFSAAGLSEMKFCFILANELSGEEIAQYTRFRLMRFLKRKVFFVASSQIDGLFGEDFFRLPDEKSELKNN